MGKSKAIRHEDETVRITSGTGAGYCEILVDSSDETADLWLEPDADAGAIEEVLTFAQLAALITAIRAIPADVLEKLEVRAPRRSAMTDDDGETSLGYPGACLDEETDS